MRDTFESIEVWREGISQSSKASRACQAEGVLRKGSWKALRA